MPLWQVHTTTRPITLPETYCVRRAVLYPNAEDRHKIHVPNDEAGIHFGTFLDPDTDQQADFSAGGVTSTDPIAVISLFREYLPEHLAPISETSKYLRFRKFACMKSYQSRGIGSGIFRHVLEYARNHPELGAGTVVWCDARWSTREWYLKRGMAVLGDRFFKGDIEYVVMAINV